MSITAHGTELKGFALAAAGHLIAYEALHHGTFKYSQSTNKARVQALQNLIVP